MKKTNQFSHWDIQELVEWIEVFSSFPQLQTENNINTYANALKELNRRQRDEKTKRNG